MEEITIYGYSDDLLEIRGAVKAEIDCWNATPAKLVFSDGTIVSAEYDGKWEFSVYETGSDMWELVDNDENVRQEYDIPSYSSSVTLQTSYVPDWYVFGKFGHVDK